MRKRHAFTIVELVIVIAVIAILAAVLIPTFSHIIEKAKGSREIQNARNLRLQLVIAAFFGEDGSLNSGNGQSADSSKDAGAQTPTPSANWDLASTTITITTINQLIEESLMEGKDGFVLKNGTITFRAGKALEINYSGPITIENMVFKAVDDGGSDLHKYYQGTGIVIRDINQDSSENAVTIKNCSFQNCGLYLCGNPDACQANYNAQLTSCSFIAEDFANGGYGLIDLDANCTGQMVLNACSLSASSATANESCAMRLGFVGNSNSTNLALHDESYSWRFGVQFYEGKATDEDGGCITKGGLAKYFKFGKFDYNFIYEWNGTKYDEISSKYL